MNAGSTWNVTSPVSAFTRAFTARLRVNRLPDETPTR
jgi:hypothetical protein